MVILFLLFLFIAKCHIVGHDNDDTAISAEFDAIAKKEAEEEAQLDLYTIQQIILVAESIIRLFTVLKKTKLQNIIKEGFKDLHVIV